MEIPKLLSGEALVAKGITKTDASLPEVGLKDVSPNGSWLEQKQVQAALEARKYLIEVERIEKCGTLSHAEWCDDLMLAEVTQKAGGYWQYLGHNVGKTLYLRPEEALYLMEVNCLLLKHNKVTVSLQKAYSLLLRSSTTMIQYRVYASLSRLGYKVFKHKGPKVSNLIKICCQSINSENELQNIAVATVDTANDTKNVSLIPKIDSVRVDTVNEPQNVGSPIDDTVNKLKNTKSVQADTRVNTMSDNNKPKEGKHNETNIISADIIGDKFVEEITDSDQNDINKENESPQSMVVELDESVQTKCTVPSTVTESNNNDVNSNIVENQINNGDNKNDIMEICTQSQEAPNSGIEHNTKELPNHNDLSNSNNSTTSNVMIQNICNIRNTDFIYNYVSKIEKLRNRRVKPSDSKSTKSHFDNLPDLFKKQVVTVNVPEQQFIPKNIFVHNANYLLNLQNIKKRTMRSASTESAAYTSSDEVNGTNIRRIRSSSGTEFPHNPNFFPHVRFPRYLYFRPCGYWRPQNNLNYYQFNMFFQRPSLPNMFFQSRSQYPPRPNPFLRSFPYPSNLNPNNPNICINARKRMRSGRTAHLQSIKNFAVRLKQYVMSGDTEFQNLESLQGLLNSYNLRYKSKLRLTENFDVINEEKIVETIELDDDEDSRNKKPRLDQDEGDKFDENLYRLRQLALRLRDLETKDRATGIHRRTFSKAIKTFNKSYNADVYLNEDTYEVIDRRYITLESSSESDCIVEEIPKPHKTKGKKLRNPFNILKRRSERLSSLNNPGTSKNDTASDASKTEIVEAEPDNENTYSELLLKTFNETWLPNENDFGRAEVVRKELMNARLVDSSKEQYLYDFMKDQFQQYQNWLEAKISFLRHLEETNIAFQNEQARIIADSEISNMGLRPLIVSDDCSDMPSLLEKLRIIKNNKEINTETSLKVDFDVYNRDVQNFRKTNPPKPHFRVICIEESSRFPPAAHVMALHSKYEDNVAIVFAIVGLGSVSYLQINPIDLPIYVPNSDLV